MLLGFVLVGLAHAGVFVTLPSTTQEIELDVGAVSEIEGAIADFEAKRFDAAARRFDALADAGGGADAYYLTAVALTEIGDLHEAEVAMRQGLAHNSEHAPLLALKGYLLAEQGRGEEAVGVLDVAFERAGNDPVLKARIWLHRGRVGMDRGEADLAEQAFSEARKLAVSASNRDLEADADQNLTTARALRSGGSPPDVMSSVAESLRRGDIAGAEALVARESSPDRVSRIRATLARADVARAKGNIDTAADLLREAERVAEEGGLRREEAYALGQLGLIHGLAGRHEMALGFLEQGIELVAGSSFRVLELSLRVEATRAALRARSLEKAATELATARKLATGQEDPLGSARLAEVEGLVAAREGRADAARASLTRALEAFEARSYWADAARVATAEVERAAEQSPGELDAARSRAHALFEKAGDPLGQAHVAIALGLGLARRGALDEALRAFSDASLAAEKVGGENGTRVAGISRENAASLLVSLGHTPEALERAGAWGLKDAVRRQEAFSAAEQAYDAARSAQEAGDFRAARDFFDSAARAFQELGEVSYAEKARRGRAWAEFNDAIDAPSAEGEAVWHRLIEEARVLDDPELRARSMAAAALAEADLKKPEAPAALRAAAAAAEQLGLFSVAGQCLSVLTDLEPDFATRVALARRAFELRDHDAIGVYAMYSVAVDAYNDGEYATALRLAESVSPYAGTLGEAVAQVREAARAALQDP